MSGHDLLPHKTTHEMVTDRSCYVCGAQSGDMCQAIGGEVAECPFDIYGPPGIAVQWTRWPQVDALRSRPAREQRQGPRSSRFGNLETMR